MPNQDTQWGGEPQAEAVVPLPTPNPRPPNFATSLIPHLPLLLTSQPLPFLIEQYSMGTGPSAHNTCAERDAKTNVIHIPPFPVYPRAYPKASLTPLLYLPLPPLL